MTNRSNIGGVEVDTEYLLWLREVIPRTKSRKGNTGSYSGYITGHKRGRGSMFYDVRPWSEGDDIRHIDSYKTARTGVPHIRTFHEDRENKIILVADFRSFMFFGTRRALRSVVVAETISMMGWRAINARNQIGLLVVTSIDLTFVGWADSASKFAGLLDKLATLHREAKNLGSPVDLCIDKALESILTKSGSASIIIATALDAPGENFNKYTSLITKRRDLVFLLISDKFERDPLPGYYPYYTQNGESGVFRISAGLAKKPLCAWPDRLARLGAGSIYIFSELDPSEVAQALDCFYDGSR
jgi:uncharacterized protein (DUF58 family)